MDKLLCEKLKIILFDCDGVIINSGDDIADSVNAALSHFEMEEISHKQLISFTGDGAQLLIARAVHYSSQKAGKRVADVPLEQIHSILLWYLDYYYAHPVVKTFLYPGVVDLMNALVHHHIRIGMVTNKPSVIAKKILSAFDIEPFFDVVTGPELLTHRKPDPEGIRISVETIAETYFGGKNCILPSEVLMVGDSAVDIQAGRSYGCYTCSCMCGFGNKEQLLAEKADYSVPYAGNLYGLLGL